MYPTGLLTLLRRFASVGLLSITLLANGCGFHAVYAKNEENDNLSDKLAQISVPTVEDHTEGQRHEGQILQTNLVKLLNPSGINPHNPAYEIKITQTLTERDLGIEGDLRVTRYDVIGTATYQLIEVGTSRQLDEGTVNTKSSYNRTSSEFSTFISAQNANELASRELAQLLKERLIYYFSITPVKPN